MTIRPDVTPHDPIEEQPAIGLIGMGGMGTMYAKHLSAAGWQKYVTSFFISESYHVDQFYLF